MANQWKKIALKNIGRLNEAGRESFIAASQMVSVRSPVDKGTFRNNWFTEINGISTKTTTEVDKSGQARLSEATQFSLKLKIGDSISFVNSLIYGPALEFGHSEQAANGMVRVTAAQWPLIVSRVARNIK